MWFGMLHSGMVKMATSMKICFHLRGLRNKITTNQIARYHFEPFRVFDGRKFPENKNGLDPVTDTPDWCYADGRPGHYTIEQKKRMLKQMDYAKKIETLLKEVDLTVDHHAQKMKKREETIMRRYGNQPKEKVPRRHALRSKMKEEEDDEE